MRTSLVVLLAIAAVIGVARADEAPHKLERNFAGSVQLDYLAVPTERLARDQALDGATVELSLKLAMDFSDSVSSNVKVCVACHGLEVGMAFFDLRAADELNFLIAASRAALSVVVAMNAPSTSRACSGLPASAHISASSTASGLPGPRATTTAR